MNNQKNKKKGLRPVLLLLSLTVVLYSCDSSNVVSDQSEIMNSDEISSQHTEDGNNTVIFSTSTNYSDHTAVLGYAEYITDPASDEAGGVEWFQKDVGNGQLAHDYVYQDPRSTWNAPEAGLTYGVKEGNQSSDVNLSNQIGWMHDSIKTWDNLACADLTLSENEVSDNTPGLVQNFFLGGGINQGLIEADLTQIGFLSSAEFPYFAINPNVLGVAFTLFWTDENGLLTDIDNNGKVDVAFRELYYNDQYEWADNGLEGPQPIGPRIFDFPTVAIHEAGHGISMAHFGNIGFKKGSLFVAPRSIMNAIYGGLLREPVGRDKGSLCSNWAQWPNN